MSNRPVSLSSLVVRLRTWQLACWCKEGMIFSSLESTVGCVFASLSIAHTGLRCDRMEVSKQCSGSQRRALEACAGLFSEFAKATRLSYFGGDLVCCLKCWIAHALEVFRLQETGINLNSWR